MAGKRYKVWVIVGKRDEPEVGVGGEMAYEEEHDATMRADAEDVRRAVLIVEPKPKRRKKNA